MSGIAGIISKLYLNQFGKVNDTLSHRGCSNLYSIKNISFSQTEFLFEFKDSNKTYAVCFSGFIANKKELEQELKIPQSSNNEIVFKLYIKYGIDFLNKINGNFAICIYSEDKLILARDKFGVSPLYYAFLEDGIVFASEMKAILKVVEPKVDKEGLSEIFFIGPAHTPGVTPFKGINELRPSYYIECDIKSNESGEYNTVLNPSLKRYFTLTQKEHSDSIEDTILKVRHLIETAVKARISKNSATCMLSGGVDSSIISYILSQNCKNLSTYSVEYAGNDIHFKKNEFQPDSDNAYIEIMQKHIKSNHHFEKIETAELFGYLKEVTIARDMPGMGDVDSSLYAFCNKIPSSVIFSGEGADEIFGGYPWCYKPEFQNLNTFPWARNIEIREKIVSKEFDISSSYIYNKYEETLKEFNGSNTVYYLNLNWFMPNLADRSERICASLGMDIHMPFCDNDVIEYVFSIPEEIKRHNGFEKGILRAAFDGVIPHEVLYRKKSPFPKTHNPDYFKAVSDILTGILNDQNQPLNDFIDKNEVKSLFKSELNSPWYGQLMGLPQLFAYLIQINIWLKEYKIKYI